MKETKYWVIHPFAILAGGAVVFWLGLFLGTIVGILA